MYRWEHIAHGKAPGKRGVVLLMTLWIAVVLSIIAYSMTFQVRLEMKLAKQFRQNAQAEALARAGLAKGIADLKNDLLLDTSEGGERLDGEGDVWANPDDKIDIELGNGFFSVLVVDQNSKININSAHPLVIKELLIALKVDEDEVENIADAIVDWRDSDDQPVGGKGQRENSFYSSLIREDSDEDFPDDEDVDIYHCKNDYFSSVEELLDVYGVTPKIFYGYDPQERLSVLLGEEDEDEQTAPPGLRDFVTVLNDDALNINTAPLEVVTAIIAASGIPNTDAKGLAEDVIRYRRKNRRKDFNNEQAFRSWRQLAEVDGFSQTSVRQIYTIQRLTTVSSVFEILSLGEVDDVGYRVKLYVGRTIETFNLDEGYDTPLSGNRNRRRSTGDSRDLIIREPTVRVIRWLQP